MSEKRDRSERSDRVIKLNVGGVFYTTSSATLSKFEGFLSSLVSGKWKAVLDEDGYIFIDRDGKMFKYVLEYLRSNAICAKRKSEDFWDRLLLEAEFYQILSLIKYVKSMVETTEADTSDTPNTSIIKLNIGGTKYISTFGTLFNSASSSEGYLYYICNQLMHTYHNGGKNNLNYDDDGYIFIDRDGKLFSHILAYLRNAKQPVNPMEIQELQQEASYYLGYNNRFVTELRNVMPYSPVYTGSSVGTSITFSCKT
jgi:hypothetical protein